MPQSSKRGGGRRAAPRKQRQSRSKRAEHATGRRAAHRSEQGYGGQGRFTTIAKALIIGIDQYGGPPNNLTSCIADADAVARFLEERHDVGELHTLNDDEATLARMEEELEWLAAESRVGEGRILYFSGHGAAKLRNGVMEECLVLHDGFLETEQFVARLAAAPTGALTVILDASFTGGPEAYLTDPTRATADLELARTKTWVPVADELPGAEEEEAEEQELGGDYRKVTGYRRFGCAPTSARGPGALELGGLLVTASFEGEPAVANTSKTSGLSAFTHALLQSIEQLGAAATAGGVLTATAARLRALGVRQTPRLVEPPTPGDLRLRRFLTLEPVTAAESLRFMSEPRFWEGVLAAGAPQPKTAWAVSRKEDDLMSTAFQPMTGGYQSPFGTTQQSFGTQPFSSEELQRVVPAIAPVLAAVIPALVPALVHAIITQQRNGPMSAFGAGGGALGQIFQQQQQPYGGAGFGGQYGGEYQQLLPVLAPVLANVIPNIVPQIVQAVLTQRQQQTGWGAGTPFLGGGGGAGYFGGDLWQTVSQSVNEALQRMGQHQMSPTGGRF